MIGVYPANRFERIFYRVPELSKNDPASFEASDTIEDLPIEYPSSSGTNN